MSYGYNNGWGGCGCGNTVQYAPSACNPNFPTYCTALGSGTIQRVVGEDSAYCKYTVPTLSSNSILFYNGSTGLVNWGDASVGNPVYLGNGSGQAVGTSSGKLQATTPTGQLVAFQPPATVPYTQEASFPVVSAGASITNWGTIENIVPNQGLVYKTGSTPPTGTYTPTGTSYASNTVYELSPNTTTVSSTASATNVVSFDANGNPIIVPATSLNTASAFTDANSVSIYPSVTSGTTNLSVNFGQVVVSNLNNSKIVINGTGNTYNLNILASGAGGLDSGTAASNTIYFIYAIYGTSVGINVVMSTSGTGPSLPSSYTYYRLIGITKTVNNSVTIDPYYNQNQRQINFGYTARQIVLSYVYGSGNNNVYFTGRVTQYISPAYVSNAIYRLSQERQGGGSNIQAQAIIGSASVGTTGTTRYAYPATYEVYAATSFRGTDNGVSTDIMYSSFNAFVPQNSINSYYNIETVVAPATTGDFVELAITGYILNIF